ncbi:hypothetical protein BU26DRAFT_93134 [Trematosphaeria pertusa]|uniref:Uncharacterized protein n=1 Tax=Trematosphaeria pertusa TaxID=390896 RepID=A0A6A6I0R0_9PLEO|nr:uncharacterized protein BU26DRAFT_93134 [Trematosphaeria pertusa]KAF2244084.1 hypothetical protein BU26DRAFT_93134 [Trematosphaeria pertusa]
MKCGAAAWSPSRGLRQAGVSLCERHQLFSSACLRRRAVQKSVRTPRLPHPLVAMVSSAGRGRAGCGSLPRCGWMTLTSVLTQTLAFFAADGLVRLRCRWTVNCDLRRRAGSRFAPYVHHPICSSASSPLRPKPDKNPSTAGCGQ